MEQGQAMEVDHDDLSAIVEASKTHVIPDLHLYWGTSIDLYKFRNSSNQEGWKPGYIFHGSNSEDLSFEGGIIEDIEAQDGINKREAWFLVDEPNQLGNVENMMVRSSTLKHVGILKPYIAGYNTQIFKAVSGFSVTTSSLRGWLDSKIPKPDEASYIPIEVQQLIRIAYMAIEKIWSAGSTSDELANCDSYDMIGDRIKINPLCTRRRVVGDNSKMPLRRAFGEMIKNAIFVKWEDNELLDFIDLLENPTAGDESVMGHPILLSPHRRQLMYHRFYKAGLNNDQKNWLQANADPGPDWKIVASEADPTLKKIIAYQARQFMGQRAMRLNDDHLVRQRAGFTPDLSGALQFSSVVTAHYLHHFKGVTQGNWREEIKGRVDLLLKKVLPRLLTRRYNVNFL